jgi:hypothetical protein
MDLLATVIAFVEEVRLIKKLALVDQLLVFV